MELELLIKGILIGFLASMPLGPIGILCIQKTVSKGRIPGFISGVGAATADTVFAIFAGLGVSFVVAFLEKQQLYFKIIGGAFIIILGFKIFFTNPVKQIRQQRKKKNGGLFADYISVFLLTLSNPSFILVFIAMFTGFNLISSNTSLILVIFAILGVFLGASSWWFTLTSIINLFRKKFRLKRIWWMNKITGGVIIAFGLLAILSLVIHI
ncbi:MAG: LysE family translocator [Bacteroidota bacterium]|nr:LysE family translocator [Bacteroidota bacterium]MDP4227518.1 LysE family translocator [Bacteroidota bacterium]MDP4274075.1 LysE family translocator [Bacteroidota bacterium]